MKNRILIITTHPIQYNAPLFKFLADNGKYELRVFYTSGQVNDEVFDKGFGRTRSWKIDLLQGYKYDFLENIGCSILLPSFFRVINPGLTQRIDSFQPTIIIVYGWNYFSHLQIMLKYKRKAPIVFRGDSTSIDDDGMNKLKLFLRYTFLKWVYRNVDYVLSPGSSSDTYFNKCGVQREKIIRVPHAVDNNWFSKLSIEEYTSISQFKNDFKIHDGDFVFLFAGKFIEKKNPLLLIDAFSELAKYQQHVRLLLVGNGVLEPIIRKKIAELSEDIANRISVLPFQDQPSMKIIYRLANYFVLSSKGPAETWGLSVNEALTSGTPVIASDKCGCSADLIKEGENGFLFQSGNPESLIDKMNKSLEKSVWEKCSRNAGPSVANFNFQCYKEAIDYLIHSFEN